MSPIIRNELAVYVSFNAAILQHALETWPAKHNFLKQQQKSGPYYYKEEVYVELGLKTAKEKLSDFKSVFLLFSALSV